MIMKCGESSDEIGPKLLKALGIDTTNLMSAEVKFYVGDPVIINATYLAEGKGSNPIIYEEIETVMKSFKVVRDE